MTRHYTHLGEEAAISAVKLLPDITDDKSLIGIPAKQTDIIKIRRLVESQNPRNWKKVRTKVLSLLE